MSSGEVFDYVIVGAGAAGCVLASRLSEDPAVSVCLIEEGGRDTSPLIHAPLGFAANASLGLNSHQYQSVPQPGLNGRRSYQPRGKVLGGSTSINAMMYVRGHPQDYDDWAALGNPGWDHASVLPYFKRAENNEVFGGTEQHGKGGPLNVKHLSDPSPANEAFLQACEAAGVPRVTDYNASQPEGCWPTQVMQIAGERCSAARAYLRLAEGRPNLQVITKAQVQRLAISAERRASGVYVQQGGQVRVVQARREVLLAAGAFGSPKLLMLSGIGRGADLQALGIGLTHESPGVGQNLQDHITCNLTWRSPAGPDTFGVSLGGGAQMLLGIFQWRRGKAPGPRPRKSPDCVERRAPARPCLRGRRSNAGQSAAPRPDRHWPGSPDHDCAGAAALRGPCSHAPGAVCAHGRPRCRAASPARCRAAKAPAGC